MIKIVDQIDVKENNTILILNSEPPKSWKNKVKIAGKEYDTEIVYDLPKSIGLTGSGVFVGEEIEFV